MKRGKGAVDKLVRVRLRDGRQANLLIHIEFQNQVDPDILDRLYTYNTRIYSLLREPVISLAVLGDDDPRWRPAEFGYSYARYETRMRFPIAKLLDYEAQWSTLEASVNPFAVIVMAHLKTLATVRQPASRLEWKLRLAKALYDRDYDEAQIQQLINFIDWLMVLDDRREARFDAVLLQYEEERTMLAVSRLEQRFTVKGLLEGRREDVLDNLVSRFDPIPEDITEAIQQITDQALLKKLHRAALQVETLDKFRDLL